MVRAPDEAVDVPKDGLQVLVPTIQVVTIRSRSRFRFRLCPDFQDDVRVKTYVTGLPSLSLP